jgi:hypothetical protein
MMKRLLFFLTLSLLALSSGQAQLASVLRLGKNQHVAGEPVLATVNITNHTGRDLVFQGSTRMQWLDFIIKDSRGNQVPPRGNTAFGSLKIGAGQTMARQVDLNQHFHLSEPGNYSVVAIVRMPGEVTNTSSTNRMLFNVNPGRPYWSQKVGLPGRPGQTREFRVLFFSGNQKTQVFAQVVDGRSGQIVRTFPLGDALSIRKPSVTIDKNQRMHVLYLANPTMWVHSIVDTDGNLVRQDVHQRAPVGDPRLVTTGDGSVMVSNSIPYDVQAAAAARAKTRKLSERPAIVYQ